MSEFYQKFKQPAAHEHKSFKLDFSRGEMKLLHHLSSLCLRGTCEAERMLNVCCWGRWTGIRTCDSLRLLVFFTLITYTAALIGPLIPLVFEKRSNTKTLLHVLSSLWYNACCHPPDSPGLQFLQRLPSEKQKDVLVPGGLESNQSTLFLSFRNVILTSIQLLEPG